MVTETISITGMHCPNCSAKVEEALALIPGIDSCSADHQTDSCVVVYDGSAQTMQAAKEAIVQCGFEAA